MQNDPSHYIEVLLPIPLDKLYTYAVSAEEAAFLRPGMRVAVPFGKRKLYTALVYGVHRQRPTAYEPKEIYRILDDYPLVTQQQLKHWQWIAEYYMCTLGEVFRSAVPAAFILESETLIFRSSEVLEDEGALADDEFLVYEALRYQSALKVHEVGAIVERKNVLPLLQRMLQKGLIRLKEEIYSQYRPKMVKYLRMAEAYATDDTSLESLMETLSRAPKQRDLVMAYFQIGASTKKPIKTEELQELGGSSRAIVRSLIDKGIMEEYEIRTDRIQYAGDAHLLGLPNLNSYQNKALTTIRAGLEKETVMLLHGVTSSGKTEVYVRLIQDCLDTGRQVLYLLPEIALTPQLIARLQGYFGPRVAVYHSRHSMEERVETWNNVLHNNENAQIVIGARSALFMPFSDLGLVVVDEEHEATYKQFDPAPRYHARDTAIVLAKIYKAGTVLGSATPSIESYFNAQSGKYGYAAITRRFGNVLLPGMELVDIKEQTRKRRMIGHFSERLRDAIAETVDAGEQVILFQNRRGYAPIVECSVCGHSPQCPNCDVSLTYHQYRNQLRCHYCGYHMATPESCPACGSPDLDHKGFGTEQVEMELQNLFPAMKIGRMDLDTTRGKHGHEKIITSFERQEIDVLVGTQMLTKGLDFRNVSLVGIMNADTLLNFPDYRAHERCYQLLTQVAGRAGRTQKQGLVLIQTYNPYHQILKQVTVGDYPGMYKDQVYERRQFRYPPIDRIIRIGFKHKDYQVLNEASEWFARGLRNVYGENVLGPEFPSVARIRNQYLKNVILKIEVGSSLSKTKKSIKRIERSFNAISRFRNVRILYNVDHI